MPREWNLTAIHTASRRCLVFLDSSVDVLTGLKMSSGQRGLSLVDDSLKSLILIVDPVDQESQNRESAINWLILHCLICMEFVLTMVEFLSINKYVKRHVQL